VYEQVRSNKVISYPHRRLGARLALGGVCLVTLLCAVGVARPKEVPAMDINDQKSA
jgi:hypothetical protein